jgi:hypothetical protein
MEIIHAPATNSINTDGCSMEKEAVGPLSLTKATSLLHLNSASRDFESRSRQGNRVHSEQKNCKTF